MNVVEKKVENYRLISQIPLYFVTAPKRVCDSFKIFSWSFARGTEIYRSTLHEYLVSTTHHMIAMPLMFLGTFEKPNRFML